MSCGCGCGGSASDCSTPCPPGPRELAFCVPTPETFAHSLARRMVGPADRLRNLLTKAGIRAYAVRWIRVRWSGGARGIGNPSVVGDPVYILPTPLNMSLDGLSRVVSAVGADEQGNVLLTEVSGCYTEEQLRGMSPDGLPTPPDENFFYEVEFMRPDGGPSAKRRFSLSGAPEYVPDQFGWRLRLERAQGDRRRDGSPTT